MASLAQMKEAQEPVEPPPPPQPDSPEMKVCPVSYEKQKCGRSCGGPLLPKTRIYRCGSGSDVAGVIFGTTRPPAPLAEEAASTRPKVKPNTRQPYMESTRQLRPRATRDDDCTFRPRVKKLPRKLYPDADRYSRRRDDRDFLTRTQRWASERDEHVRGK